jgi:hypothetical protein
MDSEYLIDCNRSSLKELFFSNLAENESPFVGFNQFISFCIKMKLYPELISLSELKRIMSNTMKKTITDEKQVEITYLQFERLLKNISEHCFPSSNSLKLMITHLKGPCSSLYSIPLTTIAPIHTVYEKQAKVSSSSKGKNTSVTHRKILNNSASQRIATSKIEAIHSPRERTLLNLKIFQQKSPRLKILNIQNKLKDDRKYEKIHRTFNVFKNTHKAILRSKRGKRLVVRFLERFIESKMRLSWMMNVTFEIWKIKSLSKPLN